MHWMLVNKQTLNTTHCDICSVFWMYAVQCVIYTVYCTVQCAVCSVQCAVHGDPCGADPVWCR